ncbi:MAG: hypothetical protein J6A98_03880 [Clostridia bacterium]|nr:hypothetical protein [Clostridia bacterium]
MFLKNILKTKKVAKKFHRFASYKSAIVGKNLKENDTRVCYNFITKRGGLHTGYGFSNLVLPVEEGSATTREVFVGNAEKCELWHFHAYSSTNGTHIDKVFFTMVDGNLGYFDVFGYNQNAVSLETEFSSPPAGICFTADDEDAILFSTDTGLMRFALGKTSTQTAVLPRFVDLCSAHGRLFGVVSGRQNKILFSKILDPSLWTAEEDSILLDELQGPCNKLIYFEDEIFAFRDYGVTKISEYGIAREFVLYDVFATKSKIFGKTVVRCGEEVLFLASDGLYTFNGATAKQILPLLSGYLDGVTNENSVACFDGENYYLACRLNFNDTQTVGAEGYEGGFKNNALVVFNVQTENAHIMRGMDIRSLLAVNAGNVCKVFATFFGEHAAKIGLLDMSGAIFGQNLPKVWKSKMESFGTPEKIKNFKQVVFDAPKDCILTIKTDLEQQSFVVVGGDCLQQISTFMRGKKFRLEFFAEAQAEIYPAKVVYEEIKE